jgi:galactokinase
MTPSVVRAFAPGRVNLIGEHTDYNRGLALPFAIVEGVTVRARVGAEGRIRARALDLDEGEDFVLADLAQLTSAERNDPAPRKGQRRDGWRLFVRGVAAELLRAGVRLGGVDLEIHGEVPRNAGLSSSAALEVSLALALLGIAGVELHDDAGTEAGRAGRTLRAINDRRRLAQLCSRVENEWLGAHTGLLDQLASLYGRVDTALRIDFADLDIQPVPLTLADGWRLVTLDSGDPRTLAASGYNERRAECTQACELLGVESLRDAREGTIGRLPPMLARRVRHVLGENARVLATVAALHRGALEELGALLDASHASLRDLYECSTPAVEVAVRALKEAGALGARLVGGGFGGHVLGLFPPGTLPPARAREVRPSRGAHLLRSPPARLEGGAARP